ncbi:protein DROOPING LEAF-like [Aristolochia californica]|uniref:protein DROOPING LEAF-like n=1 Tax=Aristolochia californica TaxID=171875 RepID=UPI0035D70CF6
MEFLPPSEHLCYIRCTFCGTILAVGIPSKRLLESITVKCGHCSNVCYISTRPMVQTHPPDFQLSYQLQGRCNEFRRSQPLPCSSSPTSIQQAPEVPFVVKPPEKKHRLPSAYNRFMKEEIQRLKAANPEIPHREAFSRAAKNWARFDPNGSTSAINAPLNLNHHGRATAAMADKGDEVGNPSKGERLKLSE